MQEGRAGRIWPEAVQNESCTLTYGECDMKGFPRGAGCKESTANAGGIKDVDRSLSREDLLEEGMATDSSILAWRIRMDRGAWRGYRAWGRRELDILSG